MSDQGTAKVGDVIEHDQPVPANVVRMTDAQNSGQDRPDYWLRVNRKRFFYVFWGEEPSKNRGGFTTAELREGRRKAWWPMTVVEVDPEMSGELQ